MWQKDIIILKKRILINEKIENHIKYSVIIIKINYNNGSYVD